MTNKRAIEVLDAVALVYKDMYVTLRNKSTKYDDLFDEIDEALEKAKEALAK